MVQLDIISIVQRILIYTIVFVLVVHRDTIAIAQMVLLEANGFVFFSSFRVVPGVEASNLVEVNVIDGVTRKGCSIICDLTSIGLNG